MDQRRIVITDSNLPGNAAEELLRDRGFDVVHAHAESESDIIRAASGAVALLVQWAPITDAVLSALPELRIISRLGIGYDMVDVEAASRRGVAVANTPDYCVEEVATHTIALLLSLSRGVAEYDRGIRAGQWTAVARPLSRTSATTVGVLGLGRIGTRVVRSARALGFTVLAHDPFVEDADILASGATPVDREQILERSDILSLHVPLTSATSHLIDAQSLRRMKRGALIVNTCRGGLIDEVALAAALESGQLGGAALDVYETEPLPQTSRLRTLSNVVLSPHAAWYSEEALRDLPVEAAQNIADFLDDRPVRSIVNAAQLDALASGAATVNG